MQPTNQKGFSLVELLVSLFILTIIIFGFTTLFTSSFSGIFTAGHKSEAIYIVQQKMESTIADIDNTDSDITVVGVEIEANGFKIQGNKITINTTYVDSRGIERTVSITAVTRE